MLASGYSSWNRVREGSCAGFQPTRAKILPVHGRYRLPDFVGIGPGRTATSWLNSVLKFRADLPAHLKETKFFAGYYYKGIDWYAWHFRHADGQRPVGEVCPYFARPQARRRIKNHLPDARIICTLRDPVDRLYSNYKMLRYHGVMPGTFLENVHRDHAMTEANRYSAHLAEWFDLFGRENVLTLFFWELRQDPQAYIDRVAEFIEAPRIDLAKVHVPLGSANAFAHEPRNRRLARRAHHARAKLRRYGLFRTMNFLEEIGLWRYCGGRGDPYPPLTPEQDAIVRKRFLREIEAVERLVARDLSNWKTPAAERRDRSRIDAAHGASARHEAAAT